MNGSFEARRRLVKQLVEADRGISRQSQLRILLATAGFPVTQATVSRDLEAVGAVKVPDGHGGGRYEIRDERRGVERAALASAVAEFVGSTAVSGNLVVLQVPPGAAHLVASRIDAAALPDVLGTVAGDDTLFVVVDEAVDAGAVAAEIEGGRG